MMRFSFPATNETMKEIACLTQPLTPNLNPWFMLIHCQLPACMFQHTLFPISSSCYFSTFLPELLSGHLSLLPLLTSTTPRLPNQRTTPSQALSLDIHFSHHWSIPFCSEEVMPMKKVPIAFPRLWPITHLANKDGEALQLVERRLQRSWFEFCEIQLMSQS